MTEIKYILYGTYGRAEAINPLTRGQFQKVFRRVPFINIKSLPNLIQRFHNMHHCDSCDMIGERIIMLDGGKHIHMMDVFGVADNALFVRVMLMNENA